MAELINGKIKIGKIEFRKKDVIARNVFSTIFKGTFEETIDVAIKRITIDLAKLAEKEIDLIRKRTDHDNVVRYYCTEQDDDFCYIAMQLCLCNLEEYVEKKGNYLRDDLKLPNTPVEEILRGAAEGLSHIHNKNIIHQDIKPSYVLLFVKENKLVAKISDFGISRMIPDHQTLSGNFSAGADLYKAPELLTPQFSWRSDVYAFGLVVFYALSKGKHLFNNSLDQIIEGNPVNLHELNGKPAALSLVKWLTAFEQQERPRMSEVVHHPFFWDDKEKLNFIIDVHQKTEDKHNPFLKEVIEEGSHYVICSSPDNCGNQRTPPDPAACADWTASLAPSIKADFPRNVNVKSCAELVRIIKNKLIHFYDPKNPVKPEYGGKPEGFRRYWLEKFPSLVVHLWEKVEVTHLAAFFSSYYAPESVRRTNVEETLRRALEQGELGDPQELLNKVKRLGSTIWERALRSAYVKKRMDHIEVLLKDGDGLVKGAEFLIELGAEVNCRGEDGRTPLHRAALNGHSAVAQFLIERGAEVDCKDINKRTPLHKATSNGHSDVAKLLIERGAKVDCKDIYGQTPFHVAASNGHSDVARVLVRYGAEVNCKDRCGQTPLHAAALNGHLEFTDLLIKWGADDCNDRYGQTPLHAAASNGHSEVANLLTYHGAEVNCKDTDEWTPLYKAASNGHSEVAKLLIERGAEVDCKDTDEWTPLHKAASNGHSEVAKLLIERGAQVDCKDRTRRTPLHIAASNGHLEVAKLLTERGADVDCKDTYGYVKTHTPLHRAASEGHSEVVKLLIERGAEVNCKNSRGNTPLDCAIERSHKETIELLRTFRSKNLPSEQNK